MEKSFKTKKSLKILKSYFPPSPVLFSLNRLLISTFNNTDRVLEIIVNKKFGYRLQLLVVPWCHDGGPHTQAYISTPQMPLPHYLNRPTKCRVSPLISLEISKKFPPSGCLVTNGNMNNYMFYCFLFVNKA